MAWFTASVFKINISTNFFALLFFATLASYSVHWYLTDPANDTIPARSTWLSVHKPAHITFFIISATGITACLFTERRYFWLILPAIILTLLYSAPKFPSLFFKKLERYIIGKTLLLSGVWAYVTAVIPLLAGGTKWQAVHWLFFFNRFSLIFAICILFDIRDVKEDRAIGIKSLVTLLQRKQIRLIFDLIIITSIFIAIILYFYMNMWMSVILAVPAFLTYFLYRVANRSNSDYLFYFILDGLMTLSPVLYMFQRIISGQFHF